MSALVMVDPYDDVIPVLIRFQMVGLDVCSGGAG
jgi:hypothetical protein